MKIKLQWKMALVIGVSTFLTIVLSHFTIRYHLKQWYVQKIEREAVNSAKLIGDGLIGVMMATNSYSSIEHVINELSNKNIFKIKLIRAEHVIRQHGMRRGEIAVTEKEKEVLKTGKTISSLETPGMLKVIYPFITDDRCGACHVGMDGKPIPAGKVNGAAVLLFDIRADEKEAMAITGQIVGLMTLVMLLSAVFILMLVHKLVGMPIANIAKSITGFSEERFETNLPDYSTLEIGIMADQIRATAKALAEKKIAREEEFKLEKKVNSEIREFVTSKAKEMGIGDDAELSLIISRLTNIMDEGVTAGFTKTAMGFLKSAENRLSLPSDPDIIQAVSVYLGGVVGACAEGLKKRYMELVLEEALTNAIVHGNLEVPSSLKDTDFELFNKLVAERIAVGPYNSRKVEVTYKFDGLKMSFVIKDEGPGFDWSSKIGEEEADPDAGHGRGLMIIKALVSKMEYNGKGNELTIEFDTQGGCPKPPV